MSDSDNNDFGLFEENNQLGSANETRDRIMSENDRIQMVSRSIGKGNI